MSDGDADPHGLPADPVIPVRPGMGMKMRPVPATVQGRVVMAPGWMMTMEPAMAMMMTMEPAMAMMLAMMTDPLPGVPVPAVRGSSQVMMPGRLPLAGRGRVTAAPQGR